MKKKKSTKCLQLLNTGIFPVSILFCYNFKYDEIIKELYKKKAIDWAMGLEHNASEINKSNYLALRRDVDNKRTGESKTLFYIILQDEFGFTDYEYCKLAHEVLHICQFMLPDILNRNKEHEGEAYLHTHIMRQCLTEIRGGK